jgi:2-polyprenyl-6-methoxyphenol hydroxylase-like FAD-dependent oxidoreductase
VIRKRIGIIGAGTAGLHLGLYLRQHDVDAVLVTDRRPEAYAEAPLLNSVAHHRVTLERERQLGVDHWPVEQFGYFCHYYCFGGEQPLLFRGELSAPSRAVDYRIYLPRLMADFAARGGQLEYRTLREADIPELAKRFDLVVVCTGKTPLGQLFPRDPRHSPLERPLRQLQVGLFTGVQELQPRGITLSIAPGHGELFAFPILSFGGMVTSLLLESIPGGDFEQLRALRYEDALKRFLELLLGMLARHHPRIRERIDERSFDLCGPRDQLQGAITPVVREGYRALGDDKWAIALGDLHVSIDPALGQGANVASHAAWILGEQIVQQDVFDARFCEEVDARRLDRILCAARWTQQLLEPPSAALRELTAAMSRSPALSNAFTDACNHPELQWSRLASPARIRRWIASAGLPAA